MSRSRILTVVLLLCLIAGLSYDPIAGTSNYLLDAQGLPVIPANQRTEVDNLRLQNPEAVIPPQCYTDTEGVHNPCYTCHQSHGFFKTNTARNNSMNDGYLQGSYDFSDLGSTNQWRNLFADNREFIGAVSDNAMQAYVDQDNYSDLPHRLRESGFKGFIPDLKHYSQSSKAFLDNGLAKDGSAWVAFNYKPLPSTFWPTNGSTDDVLIRLPAEFRGRQGKFDEQTYFLNLSLLELSIKRRDNIGIAPVNEAQLGEDIDGDGRISGEANRLAWREYYFGDANGIAVTAQQYPMGTEFMHSVRYLGISEGGKVGISTRMKELRYMKKTRRLSAGQVKAKYIAEITEKENGELPYYPYTENQGFSNSFGWSVIGWIEDAEGRLRQQSYEENLFCMGCHSTVGATIDQSFAFPRKVDGAGGWGYIDLVGMVDAPVLGTDQGEIAHYLKTVNGGDEYRQNQEMKQRWFLPDGTLNEDKVREADVYELITPSVARAMSLNKAYLKVVREQSYIYGRDAVIEPSVNALEQVDPETQVPLQESSRRLTWDIRLQWPQ